MKLGNLIPSIESMDSEVADDVKLEQINTSLIDDESEINAKTEGVLQSDEAVEDGLSAVDTLHEVQETISENDEKLTSAAVATIETLYSSIMSSLGISIERVTMESSIQSKDAWITTLEDNQKGILAKITTVIKNIITGALSVIANIFKSKYMLEKYLNNIEAKLEGSDGSKTGSVSSKFSSAHHALSALSNCSDNLKITQEVATNYKRIKTIIKSDGVDSSDEFGTLVQRTTSLQGSLKRDGFANGESIVTVSDSDDEDTRSKDPFPKVKPIKIAPGTPVKLGEALSKEEALDVIRKARGVLNDLKSLKDVDSVLRTILGSIKDISLIGMDVIRARSSDVETKNKGEIGVVIRGVQLMLRVLARNYGSVIPSLTFKNVKASIDYVKASITTSQNNESKEIPKGNPDFDNLHRFIERGQVPEIRTALRLSLNNKNLTEAAFSKEVTLTEKRVPGLFDPYSEKAFSREMSNDSSGWDEKYYDTQIVYLKTNFSKERLLHCLRVRLFLNKE